MSALGEQCFSTRPRLSPQGRAVLIRSFERCHFPSKEEKDAILHEVRKTDPDYSLTKLIQWFCNRRRSYQESKKEQKDNLVKTLLDPTTTLAREMWPSLSADTLHRLHTLLLEQPHITVQHKELLVKHFGVERKHVENFLSWRLACLKSEDNDVSGEEPQRTRRHPPGTIYEDDTMDVDNHPDSRPYLHTPASSTSPEPVYSMTPRIREQLHRRPSVNTNLVASGKHGSGWPTSPRPIIGSSSQSRPQALHISSNATPSQANSPVTTYLPSPTSPCMELSPTKLTPVSPSSASASTNVLSAGISPITRQENRSRTHASVAPAGKLPQAPARMPRTLRDFEEAYAPTYARIERFLRDVECNKYARVGLTPEMLKQVKS